jgi:hypothetical protein
MIKNKDREDCILAMVNITKVIFHKIMLMGKGYFILVMVMRLKVFGNKINLLKHINESYIN